MRTDNRMEALDQISKQISNIPGANALAARAAQLYARLQAGERLVSVFGAFSAGKSSLINALTGEANLAVSPNPTTATVSRLAFAQDGQRRAVVHAKSAEQLLDDVRAAWKTLQVEVTTLDEAAEQAAGLKMAGWSPRQRKSVSFLRAFADGWQEMAGKLGGTFPISMEQLAAYTAEERTACFIDCVDLQLDSSILEDGLSLVDTPGVDSIHRRHTDVAFRYMREADAILFVLYYTHAFSRADKDFLMQLAGVQDVAGENKLFVVLNAVDLASSPDEREAVESRVLEELRRCGIRQPRLYPVSSQLGYAAVQMAKGAITPEVEAMVRQRAGLAADAPLPSADALLQTSGLQRLQQDLVAYTQDRASELADASAGRLLSEVKRVAQEHVSAVQQRLLQSDADLRALKERREETAKRLEEWTDRAADRSLDVMKGFHADWNELLFHAGERIRIRFGGLFREAYHPGRFRTESKVREGLAEAAAELAASLERQVEIESKTLWLRMQQSVTRGVESVRDQCLAQLASVQVVSSQSDWTQAVEFPDAAYRANLDAALFETVQRAFHSPRRFFEDGGQAQALAAVEEAALYAVNAELRRIGEGLAAEAEAAFAAAVAAGIRAALDALSSARAESSWSADDLQAQLAGWQDILEALQAGAYN